MVVRCRRPGSFDLLILLRLRASCLGILSKPKRSGGLSAPRLGGTLRHVHFNIKLQRRRLFGEMASIKI
jgi:hypothetical protein